MMERNDPDLTVSKVYYPQEGIIQVHQERICFCPPELPVGYFWYGTRRHSVGRPPKWVQNLLQKGAAESHVDPDPQGAAESRVEPDLSGQGTAESCRDVEPAPVPTDESNGDPVEVSAESRSEPGTMTDASDCEPVWVDESTEDPTSFLFDYSLPTGDQICA